jgi:hypothetical protein
MDNSLLETLEHQTAPESTRGLFDSLLSDKKVLIRKFYKLPKKKN